MSSIRKAIILQFQTLLEQAKQETSVTGYPLKLTDI